EVMGVAEKGHDYFLQVTDARPDTGGLSGATPNEAVSWGKIDPARLPDSVVCYVDATVALPLITAYALARRKPRKPRRLYEQRERMMTELTRAYEKVRATEAKRNERTSLRAAPNILSPPARNKTS
ncbi:MAG: deoxyhypusine synthase family protein, partial [Candidatus Binataceae bacterium]